MHRSDDRAILWPADAQSAEQARSNPVPSHTRGAPGEPGLVADGVVAVPREPQRQDGTVNRVRQAQAAFLQELSSRGRIVRVGGVECAGRSTRRRPARTLRRPEPVASPLLVRDNRVGYAEQQRPERTLAGNPQFAVSTYPSNRRPTLESTSSTPNMRGVARGRGVALRAGCRAPPCGGASALYALHRVGVRPRRAAPAHWPDGGRRGRAAVLVILA